MKKRKCAVFLFDGFADWELALVMALLNSFTDFSIVTFSLDGKSIVSMGGLIINPHTSLVNISKESIDLLLLPGGHEWENGGNTQIIPFIKNVIANKKMVAAICAATILLGNAGLLNEIPHTSNMLHYLKKHSPAYTGEKFYENKPCVATENIITANGAGMIEFSYEICKSFRLLDPQILESWKEMYKSGGMINKLYTEF
jgi:putative intracellular protease/amidase